MERTDQSKINIINTLNRPGAEFINVLNQRTSLEGLARACSNIAASGEEAGMSAFRDQIVLPILRSPSWLYDGGDSKASNLTSKQRLGRIVLAAQVIAQTPRPQDLFPLGLDLVSQGMQRAAKKLIETPFAEQFIDPKAAERAVNLAIGINKASSDITPAIKTFCLELGIEPAQDLVQKIIQLTTQAAIKYLEPAVFPWYQGDPNLVEDEEIIDSVMGMLPLFIEGSIKDVLKDLDRKQSNRMGLYRGASTTDIGSQLTADLTTVSQAGPTPLNVARAVFADQLERERTKFGGLVTASELTGGTAKIPSSGLAIAMKKRLREIGQAGERNTAKLQAAARFIAFRYSVPEAQAVSMLKAADAIANDIQTKGLLYRGEPFNFALSAPYSIDRGLVDDIARVSTQALQATYQLAKRDPFVEMLLNKGSTPLERATWRQSDGYEDVAPLNRIDLVSGKVIEFGPTFVDGFATAQIFADVWGMGSKSVATLTDSFLSLYNDFCDRKGFVPKTEPSLGLGFISETKLMEDEMRALARYIEGTKRFGPVSVDFIRNLARGNSDLLFYYLKPSMLDGWNGSPIPEGDIVIRGAERSICVVPPIKQQLGKKVVLALFGMYPEYYTRVLGDEDYQKLMSFTTPTSIVTPETRLPGGEIVLKPSSGGSCDGVIGSDNIFFEDQFRKAQADYPDLEADAWVIQPQISQLISPIWVFSAKNGLRRLDDPKIKQTLMVAGGKVAGAFTTASVKWIIDDSGYGFPCKIRGAE